MKLIVAIVQDEDSHELNKALRKNKFAATQLRSSGSFLRAGNTTFLIGVKDELVEDVLEVIKEFGKHRTEFISPTSYAETSPFGSLTPPVEVPIGGATVFVLPVDDFIKF
ncbi:cyclic-di-AMP receptor [Bavariicoccus seileri]|uniref:cyclic-di-AMP receptor n=1 Tax=Bavariicoccus seileri TaxID=549685 RepID=UPI0003B438D7|nr:cyclic-di-AMP receptor [Bavariicoccus seileri]